MANNSKSDLALAMLVRLISGGWTYAEAEEHVAACYGMDEREKRDLKSDWENRWK